MKLYPLHSRKAAVTLLEMIVVIAVLATLTALLMPVLTSALERGKAAECLHRLRQAGVLFNSYVAEHENRVRFLRDGSGAPMWYDALRDHAEMSEAEARKAFGCPSFEASTVGPWWCYGMRLSPFPPVGLDPGVVERDAAAGYYAYSILSVERPSRFLLMADTVTADGQLQVFRIVPSGVYGGSGIHLRHANMANVLFLDGHVESMGTDQLHALGITQVLDAEHQVVSTAPNP